MAVRFVIMTFILPSEEVSLSPERLRSYVLVLWGGRNLIRIFHVPQIRAMLLRDWCDGRRTCKTTGDLDDANSA